MKSELIEAFAVMALNGDGKVVIYHVCEVKDLADFIVEEFRLGSVSISIAKETIDETTQTSPAECL